MLLHSGDSSLEKCANRENKFLFLVVLQRNALQILNLLP